MELLFGDQSETRRSLLDEWMREITLNESCMTSTEVTASLYDFVGFDPSKNCAIPEPNDPYSVGPGIINKFATAESVDTGKPKEGESRHQGNLEPKPEPNKKRLASTPVATPLVFATSSEKATATLKNFRWFQNWSETPVR